MKFQCLGCKLLNSILLLILINFVFVVSVAAQTANLIRDPSFEDTITLQGFVNTQLQLKHWKSLDSNKMDISGSAYFSLAAPAYKLPNAGWFYQYPHSGLGFPGLDNVFYNGQYNYRAKVRTKLKTKLTAGKTYCVKIYAVFADLSSLYATDGLQLYFDNGGLDTMISVHNDKIGIYPFITPQVSLTQGQVLTDTMNWNLLMGKT